MYKVYSDVTPATSVGRRDTLESEPGRVEKTLEQVPALPNCPTYSHSLHAPCARPRLAAGMQSREVGDSMRFRYSILVLLTLPSAASFAEAHQNMMTMQAMQGNEAAQQMMMMQMMSGAGGGSGSGASYESKRDDIQKAFEQPAKDSQKRTEEAAKSFSTALDKIVADSGKSFLANTAKDEKLDEKVAAQISAPPPSNSKTIEDSTAELIGSTKGFAEAAVAAAAAQAKGFVNAKREQVVDNTMAARMGSVAVAPRSQGLAAAVADRTPASEGGTATTALQHSEGANGGQPLEEPGRGFGRDLIHNPPKGF